MIRLHQVVLFSLMFYCLCSFKTGLSDDYFYVTNSSIKFNSFAKLELLGAESNKMTGVLNSQSRNFSFAVRTTTFNGFNSALQQEHFNENFLESEKYPISEFKGKIIEVIDFEKPGTYNIRAKGILTIHGISQERIIKCLLTVQEEGIDVETRFSILLKDHNIKVPKVVHEKIATEILVSVKAQLRQNQD